MIAGREISISRNCPKCEGRIGYWDTFLPGRPDTGYCHACGTALQFRLGVFGHVLRFVIPFAGCWRLLAHASVADALGHHRVLAALHDFPAIPVALFFRWYLMTFATIEPGGGRPGGKDNEE